MEKQQTGKSQGRRQKKSPHKVRELLKYGISNDLVQNLARSILEKADSIRHTLRPTQRAKESLLKLRQRTDYEVGDVTKHSKSRSSARKMDAKVPTARSSKSRSNSSQNKKQGQETLGEGAKGVKAKKTARRSSKKSP